MDRIKQSTDYEFMRLDLEAGGETFDIREIWDKIEIHESIEEPFMQGSLILRDTNDIIDQLDFTGEDEKLHMTVKTPTAKRPFVLEKTFHVFSLNMAENTKPQETVYILEFVSPEYIVNIQKQISRSFKNKPSKDHVKNILSLDLESEKEFVGDSDDTALRFVMPFNHPLAAIRMLMERSMLDNVADFFFFENRVGYNFRSLSEMMEDEPKHEFFYGPQGSGRTKDRPSYNYVDDIYTVEDAKQSFVDRIMTGQAGLNVFSYNRETKEFNYNQEGVHASAHDSTGNRESISKESRMKTVGRLYGAPHTLSMGGSTTRAVGDVFELVVPRHGSTDGTFKKSRLYSGTYLITKIVHSFTNDFYDHTLEAIKK